MGCDDGTMRREEILSDLALWKQKRQTREDEWLGCQGEIEREDVNLVFPFSYLVLDIQIARPSKLGLCITAPLSKLHCLCFVCEAFGDEPRPPIDAVFE
jgi:hypothetical protein